MWRGRECQVEWEKVREGHDIGEREGSEREREWWEMEIEGEREGVE